MSKPLGQALREWNTLSFDEKMEIFSRVMQSFSWLHYAELVEPECPYDPSPEGIEKLKNLKTLEKFADFLIELSKRKSTLATEEIVKSVLYWWFAIIVVPAGYLYRKYLIQALIRRGIAPRSLLENHYGKIKLSEQEIKEREILFPKNWSLKGMPSKDFTVDDIIFFEEMKEKLSEYPFKFELPAFGSVGYCYAEIEPPSNIDLEQELVSYGEPTGDYVYRSIAECPCFFYKIPGFDVEEELENMKLPLFSPDPEELKQIEKVYWEKIEREIEGNKSKIPDLSKDFYEKYAQFQIRAAYDEAYGQLYMYFQKYLSWAYDDAKMFIQKVLMKDEKEAKQFLEATVQNMLIELLERFKEEEEES